jgi:hypothetical protein
MFYGRHDTHNSDEEKKDTDGNNGDDDTKAGDTAGCNSISSDPN